MLQAQRVQRLVLRGLLDLKVSQVLKGLLALPAQPPLCLDLQDRLALKVLRV